ncbi:MAG: hypothetical protein MUD16_05270 [Desulfobacterales bacterium]|jgi:hypothetical protein|nr:hypothetical protein [Desulfobacterales bacterium]
MGEWIPFEEGRYRAERVLLLAGEERAVAVEDAVIDVAAGPAGRRRLQGRGRVQNELVVRLLDESEELDVLLDLGGEFKYRMRRPAIQGGKVFSPGVQSFIVFAPQTPWEQLSEEKFNSLTNRVRILDGAQE